MLTREKVEALSQPQYINEILQTVPEQSVVLQRAKRVQLSKKKATQPVLATLPEAYWVNGDAGLKQTTEAMWKSLTITAEELAVIVPIPDAVVDDSDINLWETIKPLLVEAIGKKLDEAVFFGGDKPASWPTAIVPGAIAAGNVVKRGTEKNFAADVATLAGKVSKDGFAVSSFVSAPGLSWDLRALTDDNGRPIYGAPLTETQTPVLYGLALDEMRTGGWHGDVAELVALDWTKFVIGVRQDVTFKLLDQAMITDNTGKVLLNLPQQDMQAIRVVLRVGFQVANPLTRLNKDETKRYPAGVVTPNTTPPRTPTPTV